ncbi:MAG: hypothetical protein RLZZ450_4858 [Pseudomonadota bacterium]|jgi:hypothetical protein
MVRAMAKSRSHNVREARSPAKFTIVSTDDSTLEMTLRTRDLPTEKNESV